MLFCQFVVPHAGTWIEMAENQEEAANVLSFPTRERGLKFDGISVDAAISQSFPTRERGLK